MDNVFKNKNYEKLCYIKIMEYYKVIKKGNKIFVYIVIEVFFIINR